jgi:competence protein ComEA
LLIAAFVLGAVFAPTYSAPAPIQVQVREAIPTPTVVLYVHVDGAVRSPGVYALESRARIFDAIDAAGGTSDDAELRELNLAALVVDGQKLVVPRSVAQNRDSSAVSGAVDVPAPATTMPVQAATARINVNTASQRVLESLPGIGPVTAKRIIERRESDGPFARVEQLRELRIVNASTFGRIKELVSAE